MSSQPDDAPTGLTAHADVLAEAVRRLVEVVVRTQAEGADVLAAAGQVDAITATLSSRLREGPWTVDRGTPMSSPYNTVSGSGNPFAAPLRTTPAAGSTTGQVRFGTAYEGAPGLVHGGVLALALDQLFGDAALAAGVAGMTVGLELRFTAPTPVHTNLALEAHVVEAGDRIVRLAGSIRAGNVTTVTATATFFRLTPDHARTLFPHLVRE